MNAQPAPVSAADPASADESVWLQSARDIVSDLFQRSPLIYWTDFLASITMAWGLTAAYFLAPPWSLLQIAAFALAGVLFFRAGTRIHKIIHLPEHETVWLGRIWNLLQGIPLLMSWIMYRNHVDRHNPRHFGTPADGEYLPLAVSPIGDTIKYLAQAPLLPLFMLVRFGVLGLLSYLRRGLREWVLTRASAAVSNVYFRKRCPKRDDGHLVIMELLCFGYLCAIAVLLLAGVITGTHLLMAYLLLAYTLGLNWVRNLAAHGCGNPGERMTYVEQVGDSINITGQHWLTVLLFPVGLRYHALHHLFPALPYRNLGEAHRRLTERLPPEAPYHATGRASFFAAASELWRSARQTPREDSAMCRWNP